jgi:hypothetical protein
MTEQPAESTELPDLPTDPTAPTDGAHTRITDSDPDDEQPGLDAVYDGEPDDAPRAVDGVQDDLTAEVDQ